VPVDRFVGIGLVRPVTLRPVAGVCASVDSRPVPPRRFFGEPFFAAARDAALFGRLALEAVDRRFGADALLDLAAGFFVRFVIGRFFCAFALRAGFLAILDSPFPCERPDLTVRP
jgi:hypothetical protein